MRSIIKSDKTFKPQKKLSISPVLTYINDDLRKSNQAPPKLRKSNHIVNEYLNDNDSDYEYY
jgi:hypothetical protein